MENKSPCPVCGTPLQTENGPLITGDRQYFDCPRCGKYELSRSLEKRLQDLIEDEEKKVLLSFTIRKMQGRKEVPFFDSYLVNTILKNELPSLLEQINIFLLWLGDINIPGEKISNVKIEFFQTVIGAKTVNGTWFVLNYLQKTNLIELTHLAGGTPNSTVGSIELTMPGWVKYDELKRGAMMSHKAFMAMQYGDSDLEWMFENCFQPAVKATGFNLYRADRDPKPGLIDDQLRVEIRTSRFLISDLTHDNGGAYWEAGFAEGLGKPVIYICEKKKFEEKKTHFDTNHQKTFTWERNNPDEALRQLKATIRATLPDEAILVDEQD